MRPALRACALVILMSFTATAPPARAKAPPRTYKAAGGIVTDLRTGLAWQQLVSGTRFTLDEGKAYCKALNLNGTGWRLPTIRELQTLCGALPGIDPVFLPTTDPAYSPDSATGYYWASTKVVGNGEDSGWVISAQGGYTGNYGVTVPLFVRCVR
jgi:hypothetical protein